MMFTFYVFRGKVIGVFLISFGADVNYDVDNEASREAVGY